MVNQIVGQVAKLDLMLLFVEKAMLGSNGILPLGGDHVMQIGILSMGAFVIQDLLDGLARCMTLVSKWLGIDKAE